MNAFLEETAKAISNKVTEKCCIIIGNESCDLDSAISSLTLAYYYDKNKSKIPNTTNVSHVIPLFNIRREELPIKTEVIFFLKLNAIELDNITCKDDITESFITSNYVILVDHHLSKYSPISVFDHRPFDASSTLPKECNIIIEQVTSCATLIAEVILNDEIPLDYKNILQLLYATIVLDTSNFSAKAGRKDIEISKKIESILDITNIAEYRWKIFKDLIRARDNVSTLNSYQLLLKDMKVISSKNDESIKITLPGFPVSISYFINLPKAKENIRKFAEQQGCQIIVLIGKIKVPGEKRRREIGIIDMGNPKLFSLIVEALYSSESRLNLEEYTNFSFLKGRFFNQKNIYLTRKQILPLVKSVLDGFSAFE